MRNLLLKIRFLLIPASSRREQVYHAFRLALIAWREIGFLPFIQRFPSWLRLYLHRKAGSDTYDMLSWTYPRWIKKREPGKRELARQRKDWPQFPYQPLISILTPVFNPPPDVLQDTLESVRAQTYPNWELCLADGASDRPGVRQVLDDFARRDPRIKVVHLPTNQGIAANSNQALKMAQGEYLSLLDHDDLLAPDYLYQVVHRLNQDPSADIIYYDEDKISADGRERNAPWFKPGALSPDLLLSTNYLMHSVIRRSLLLEVGEFDPTVDGAQDWDLSLRLIEKQPRIVHIPRIFYHWRQVPGSAASDANAKPWAFAAQARCLQKHLARLGLHGASVDFPSLGLVHIRWPVSGRKVSIIIPTKDKVHLLRACLSSIFAKTSYPNYEIILVDNGSIEPETLAYYQSLAGEKRLTLLHYPHPFNFHAINNFASRHANGEILVFLNNDTEILNPEWLEELVGWAERPEIGIVGAKLIRPDGTIQHAGLVIGLAGHGSHVFDGARGPLYGPFGSTEWYRNYQAVTGACMAIRRQVFEQLHGFDELYRVGYGDIDLCLRAVQAGYRVVYNPFACLLHHEGATRRLSQPPSDVLRASISMYPRVQAGDPFFNPNLSTLQRIPSLPLRFEPKPAENLLHILRAFDLISPDDLEADDPKRWPTLAEVPSRIAPADGAHNHLLLVTHDLSRSGAPILLYQVACHLAENGYQITVLSSLDGPLHQDYTQLGITVRILPPMLKDARCIVPHLAGQDLVIVNTILCFRNVHAARAYGKPCLFWIHESTFGQKLARTFPGVADSLHSADIVLFPSQATASLYHEFSDPQHYVSILSGIDYLPPDPAPQKKPGKCTLITVASIESRKGQDILLQALQRLPPQINANLECLLVGRILYSLDKTFCRRVVRFARRMSNAHILGDIPSEQVRQHLAEADIFVLPSRDEALPLAMLEAMAAGKAIVATRVGGNAEIIEDGLNGLLVEKEDPQAMSAAIARLCADPHLRQALGAAAQRTYQEKLTGRRFRQQFLALVNRMLSTA